MEKTMISTLGKREREESLREHALRPLVSGGFVMGNSHVCACGLCPKTVIY